jgi:anti-sigma factor RsiW
MSHLDEGMIHALLDGEIPSAELPPIQAHLGGCAECRARLAEEQELLATSDRLIELIEVPAVAPPGALKHSAPARRTWPRNVAWAATVVLAAGLGYSARGSMGAGPAREVPAPETVFARSPEPTAPGEKTPVPPDSPRNAAEVRQSGPPAAAPRPTVERSNVAVHDAAREAETRERKVTADSLVAAKIAAGANVAAVAPPAPVRDTLSAPAVRALAPTGRLQAAPRRLGDTQLRLEELVVTGVDERVAQAKIMAAATPVSFPDAVRRLGGSLRLIEGLIPERLEALGSAVRVVYLTRFGDLVLSQELDDGKLRYTLIAPPGFPPDSLEKLRARVRE